MQRLAARLPLQSPGTSPTQRLDRTSAPEQPHPKYIAFHQGGFLQVAVSEAPLSSAHHCTTLSLGAPDNGMVRRLPMLIVAG
jgi:hypothetical protein